LDFFQPSIAANGTRLFANELHAVVVGRIVARRHHDAAIHLFGERGEVHALSAAKSDVIDVDTGIQQTLRERLAQLCARQSDVSTDDHSFRFQKLRVGAADAVRDTCIQLAGKSSPIVVCLETDDWSG
jgi:hypothetical protein